MTKIADLLPRAVDFEQHDRRSTLGASEAPGVMGHKLAKYSSPHRVWMEKRGIIEPEDISNEPHIKRGVFGERLIQEEFSRLFPKATCHLTSRHTFIHPDHEWLSASPDIVVEWPDALSLVDAKWPSFRMLDEWGDPNADRFEGPDRYRLQALWQMIATGIHTFVDFVIPWDLDRWEFRVYRCPWDERAARDMFETCSEFWQRCVVDGEEPEWDGSDDADEYLASKWPAFTSEGRDKADVVDLTGDPRWLELATKRHRLKKLIENAEIECKRIAQEFADVIGESYGAEVGGGVRKVSYFDTSRKSVGWKSIAEELGIDEETIERHTRRSSSRVLRITYEKGFDEKGES